MVGLESSLLQLERKHKQLGAGKTLVFALWFFKVGPRMVFNFDVMCFGATQVLFSRDLQLYSGCNSYLLSDSLEMKI